MIFDLFFLSVMFDCGEEKRLENVLLNMDMYS